jgi:hypothetical protein
LRKRRWPVDFHIFFVVGDPECGSRGFEKKKKVVEKTNSEFLGFSRDPARVMVATGDIESKKKLSCIQEML